VAADSGDDLDLSMDLDLDMETGTVSDDDELDIDLETMLDEEEEFIPGDEKEVSLETVEEREQQIEREYKKTVEEEPVDEEPIEDEVPEKVTEFMPDEETVEQEIKAEASAAPVVQKVKEKRDVKKILLVVLILITLGAVILAGWKFFSAKEEAPTTKPPVVKVDPGYRQIEMIANPEYKFVENELSGELLVITGHVTNRYDHPRSDIQVEGTIYDSTGKVIVTSKAYCGNMLTESDVTSLELETITERLNNRKGDNNINSGIETGKNVPFTVVFSSLPESMHDFTMEVILSIK